MFTKYELGYGFDTKNIKQFLLKIPLQFQFLHGFPFTRYNLIIKYERANDMKT